MEDQVYSDLYTFFSRYYQDGDFLSLRRYKEGVYANRLGDGFPYKDNYRHSSWLTMMRDRIGVAINYLRSDGALFSNIDENERDSLQSVLDMTFGKDKGVVEVTGVNPGGNSVLVLWRI